jgi:response regulator RpfG family c-di-GMP phosphodiesterase
MPVAEALEELRRCSGTQFRPEVVELFCELAAELEPVT